MYPPNYRYERCLAPSPEIRVSYHYCVCAVFRATRRVEITPRIYGDVPGKSTSDTPGNLVRGVSKITRYGEPSPSRAHKGCPRFESAGNITATKGNTWL